MSQHPDIVDLEAVRTGEGDPAHASHVASCPACRRVLHDLEAIATDVSRLDEPAVPVPAELDARILWNGRKRALALRRRRALRRSMPWAAAAAVAIVATITLRDLDTPSAPVRIAQPTPASEPERVAARSERTRDDTSKDATAGADINGDGRFDVLDAFAAARALKAEAPGLDANADGVTDGRDVDSLAMRIVALDGGAS